MHDLDTIYRQHANTVYRFLLAKTGSADLSEELTQETFFQAVSSIERYDGRSQIGTWLCGIAKNVLLTHYRKQQREDVSLEEIPEPSVHSAEDAVLNDMDQETVLIAIHRLPEPGREIMHLRLLGGLSFKQIGGVFGQSETWARVMYYRAKQTIVKELSEHAQPAFVQCSAGSAATVCGEPSLA
ncbi:MAG: sigma-70 family RNA polymerase sigma factor [Oscillospiraceae bacterium]|nr:sigma-70 family RNA polymerase sigma factor [Oscillospiraceae bacterium]